MAYSRIRRHWFLILTAVLATVATCTADVQVTGVWPAATPESQGLDSGVLAEMLTHVRTRQLPLHSVLIVRHGRLVFDATLYPFEPDRLHDIASATKSVTSILIGIAIDKGYLKSVDQRVSDILPVPASAAADPRRDRLTIKHLLTMTSGLHCGVEPGERELAAMRNSDDWAAFALALPMWAEPGTKYAYCSCNNHVLSSIISARTGDSALTFARKHLFEPLGIKEAVWPADPRGRTHGWGDLQLKPHDLAKLGYLYLQGGRWNGKQIVPADYVRQSIAPHVTVRDGVGYGYSWWINTKRTPAVFEMTGRGGQRVAVLPDQDLVVAFNSGGLDTDELAPFLFRALAPASTAATPTQLPEIARTISGKRFAVAETNPLKLQHLSLDFSSQAQATIRFFGGEWTVPVGLDGRPRVSTNGPSGHPMAAKGEWISPREFVLDLDTVANINHFIIRMTFAETTAEREVQLRIDEKTGELKDLPLTGRLQ